MVRSFIIRHRFAIQDLSIIAAVAVVVLFVAFEVDIFENEVGVTEKQLVVELDEILLLGGMVAVGLLAFAVRRYREQKREMQRRIAAEQHARTLAFQDALTGLANRRRFDDALKAAVGSPPSAGAVHAVLLLDLNGFKQVNDVHGHGVGDEVLVAVAQRLQRVVRDGDLVARFGGDEFAILAMHLVGAEAANTVAQRVINVMAEPIVAGPTKHHVGVGIGIALLPDDAHTEEESLRKADVALYRAKRERRSAMRFFAEDMDRIVHERHAMESALQDALATNAIRAFFHPAMDLRTRKVIGFEAKPRWLHPTLGEIQPERFLPIAEETGLIHELADRLLVQACRVAMTWPAEITLSVDVFPGQITAPDLDVRIRRVLEETGLPPQRLELEIAESALVHDLQAAQKTLGFLHSLGVRIALDNFGTGYSSLYHLRNFKIDKIKIDRSFVEGMNVGDSAGIINALIGFGHGLGLTIAAEGVNDSLQQNSLLLTGCDQGQGGLLTAVSGEETTTFFVPELPTFQRQAK